MSRLALLGAGAAGVGDSLFLDSPGLGSSAAAWSIARKMSSSYLGSAIRVRESSGNTELDIGFNGSSLDTAALLAHCGANNGFVVTVYDQSGNARNLTQSTAANQPQIVNAGALFTGANSKPECRFDGTNDRMTTGAFTFTAPTTYFMVCRQISFTNGDRLIDGLASANKSDLQQFTTSPNIVLQTDASFITLTTHAIGSDGLLTCVTDTTSSSIRRNNDAAVTGTLLASVMGGITLGCAQNLTAFGNMGFQELVLYPINMASGDQTTARGRFNDFYALY